ncbi:MAG: M23 family metallopeptidase [Candidatus Dormibacteraceae bacterium]
MKILLAVLAVLLLGLLSEPAMPAPAAPLDSTGRGLPGLVAGATVTQPFGCTALALEPPDASCPGGHFHSGIDLAAPVGTPVRAAAGGLVKVVRSPGGYGLHVFTTGPMGTLIIYGHLSAAVAWTGEEIVAGQEVGRVGTTGNSSGPHLHFEVRVNGIPVDPVSWLARGSPTGPGRNGGNR